jgi:hypothetical protein
MCTTEKTVEAYLKILTITVLGRLAKSTRSQVIIVGAPAEERTCFSLL